MKKYLRKLALFILKPEWEERNTLLKESQKMIGALSGELEKTKKKLSKVIEEHEIILKDYRVDNIGADGIPPSYLPANDEKLYKAKIFELNDVFKNETFREMLSYSINFHANLAVTGQVKNEQGDMVDIPTEHVQYMVKGIKSIWELLVAARNRKKQIETVEKFDPHEIMPEIEE